MNDRQPIDLDFWKKFAQFWSPVKAARERDDIFDGTPSDVNRNVIMDEADIIDATGDLEEDLSLI